VERIAREHPVVRLRTFVARDAILWKHDDRIVSPIVEKLRCFGCTLRDVLDLPRDVASIRASIEERLESGATLFLISGSNALDPLDPVFGALEQLGATMRRIGIPVHPGTLLWIAMRDDVMIVGLPSCGLRGQTTAFDLVLPRILAEGASIEGDFAVLGHGGILSHARAHALDEEPVDDPVR
jgi:molybdopterin biosynthesis enzyme